MTLTDWIGTTGVTLLLFAFFLNSTNRLPVTSLVYILLNLSGALLACLASVLLNYIPFVILEIVWAIVSLSSLVGVLRKKTE